MTNQELQNNIKLYNQDILSTIEKLQDRLTIVADRVREGAPLYHTVLDINRLETLLAVRDILLSYKRPEPRE